VAPVTAGCRGGVAAPVGEDRAGRDRGTGTIVAADGIALFHDSRLPRLPHGQADQLWHVDGQDSQSAGVRGRGGELSGFVTGMAAGDSVGVTVEPASGSDHPTSDPVFLFAMA
jgi:anti-sigma-K factor RskA